MKKHECGSASNCRKCYNAAKSARWRAANPERARATYKRANAVQWATRGDILGARNGGKRYGISPEEYRERLSRPCEICGTRDTKKKSMAVDHDHATNKLRGTLCNNCNNGLGRFKDDTSRLLSAIQYLARYRGMVDGDSASS